MTQDKEKKKEIDLKLEDFFHILSDTTRLNCIILIQEKGESCVCALASVLKLSQPKISRHLAILRQHGIVEDRRSGLWVYYKINNNLPTLAKKTLKMISRTLKNTVPYCDFLDSLIDLNDAACKLALTAQNDEKIIRPKKLAEKNDSKTNYKATG